MKFVKRFGETSVKLRVFLQNSSLTTGAGLTGLTYASTGLTISIISDASDTANSYAQGSGQIEDIATVGTWVAPSFPKCRFKEITATFMPGMYEIQFADGIFTLAGTKSMQGLIFGATNLAPTPFEIQMDAGEVIADQIVARNVNGGSNTGRTIKQAFHAIRNKWTSIAGVYTVYDVDDATVSWTSATTSDGAAPPITGSDPA